MDATTRPHALMIGLPLRFRKLTAQVPPAKLLRGTVALSVALSQLVLFQVEGCGNQNVVFNFINFTCSQISCAPTHVQACLSLCLHSCSGKNICTIKASNSVFGDPCVGTYKYLELAYICECKYPEGQLAPFL